MPRSSTSLSGEQIRAARAFARIDQAELARRCGLSLETIKRLERIRGPVDANSRTLRAILQVFEAMGVVFESDREGSVGVRLVPPGLRPSPVSLTPTVRHPAGSDHHRLIYHSIASPGEGLTIQELLNDLQVSIARHNAAMDVTGVLFSYGGHFLSAIEGSKANVRQVYGAISCDRRHHSLSIISDQTVPSRRFSDWSVCCGLFASDAELIGNEPALIGGLHLDGLSPASALGLLSVIRDLRDIPPRTHLRSRYPCPLAAQCLDRICALGDLIDEAGAPPGSRWDNPPHIGDQKAWGASRDT